jgi:hypothetical protein
MFQNNSEQAEIRTLNLQFFAGEGDGIIDSTPTIDTVSTTPSEQGVTDQTEESFVDADLLSDEIKNSSAFKGMQKAYTQKTQEIAEFRTALKDAGMSPQQAASFIKAMNENPVETMTRLSESFGYKLTKAEQQQIAQAQTEQTQTQDDLEVDPDDEYAQKLIQIAEKRALKKFEPLLSKIDPLLKQQEAHEKAEAQKFFAGVDQAISKVLADYPEAGLKKDQLFEVAKRYRLAPEEINEKALMLAVGHEKYVNLVQQKQLRTQGRNALENQQAVAPMVTGQPPNTAPQKPKTFAEATKNALSYFNSL